MKPFGLIMCLSLATLARGQRPFFAGSRPIGFPELTTEALGDRYGELDGTTQRLPVEANGDRDLVDRLSKLPVGQQPFWLINWQALEENRKNPQTYPQKPNVFAESAPSTESNTNTNSNPGFGNVNPSNGNGNPNFGQVSPSTGSQVPNSANQSNNSGGAITNQGFQTSNRFGVEEYPNNKDKKKQEYPTTTAKTNTITGYGKPVPLGVFDKKKPVQNNYYESYRF